MYDSFSSLPTILRLPPTEPLATLVVLLNTRMTDGYMYVCIYILKYIRVTRVIPMESVVSYNIYIIIINHELSHLHHHRYNQQHSII